MFAIQIKKLQSLTVVPTNGPIRFLRKTVTSYLKPDLYALVDQGKCDEVRTVNLKALVYETSETWTELKFVPEVGAKGQQ